MTIDPQMLFLALVLLGAGIVPWMHTGEKYPLEGGVLPPRRWAPRMTAWCVALGFCLLTLAVPQWLDALAAFTAGKVHTAILGAVWFACFLCWFFQALYRPGRRGRWRRKQAQNGIAVVDDGRPRYRGHYHRVRTPVLCAIAGITTPLAWGHSKALFGDLHNSPSLTGSAFRKTQNLVQSGAAAKALSHAEAHLYLILGILAFAGFTAGLWVFDRRLHGRPVLRRGGAQGALPPPGTYGGPGGYPGTGYPGAGFPGAGMPGAAPQRRRVGLPGRGQRGQRGPQPGLGRGAGRYPRGMPNAGARGGLPRGGVPPAALPPGQGGWGGQP